MAKVQGSHGPVRFSEKDFPPLSSSSPKPSSSSPAADPLSTNPTSVNSASKDGSSSLHAAVSLDSSSPPSWTSLFHSDQAAKLQYHQPLIANGKPFVFIPKSVHKLGIVAWEDFSGAISRWFSYSLSNSSSGSPDLGSPRQSRCFELR